MAHLGEPSEILESLKVEEGIVSTIILGEASDCVWPSLTHLSVGFYDSVIDMSRCFPRLLSLYVDGTVTERLTNRLHQQQQHQHQSLHTFEYIHSRNGRNDMKSQTLLEENPNLFRLCIPYSSLLPALTLCTKLRSLRIWRDAESLRGYYEQPQRVDLYFLENMCSHLEQLEVSPDLNICLPCCLPRVRMFKCASSELSQMMIYSTLSTRVSDPKLVFPNLERLRLRDSKKSATIGFEWLSSHPKLTQIDIGEHCLTTFVLFCLVDRKHRDKTYCPALTHICSATFSLCLVGATPKMIITWCNHYLPIPTNEVNIGAVEVRITEDMARHWNSILLPHRFLLK